SKQTERKQGACPERFRYCPRPVTGPGRIHRRTSRSSVRYDTLRSVQDKTRRAFDVNLSKGFASSSAIPGHRQATGNAASPAVGLRGHELRAKRRLLSSESDYLLRRPAVRLRWIRRQE